MRSLPLADAWQGFERYPLTTNRPFNNSGKIISRYRRAYVVHTPSSPVVLDVSALIGS